MKCENCKNYEPKKEHENTNKDKEKLQNMLDEFEEYFYKLDKQADNLRMDMYALKNRFGSIVTLMKKINNEEKNHGNIHKNCEFYSENKDMCINYAMCGLAYECSRHKTCIDKIIK